jgi:aryl-alcohol dehydrogenase-like predicted oxidoreductase
MKTNRTPLPAIPRYTFGSMSLGQGRDYDLANDVKVARAAMESGVWFHTSDDYADCYKVLRRAFDEDRAHVPRLIVKMDANIPEKSRAVIEGTRRTLGVDRVDIAQMCCGDASDLARDAREGNRRWETFREMKEKGWVGNYLVEVWPNATSCRNAQDALETDLVDGLIFYYNLLERFVSNELFDHMEQRKTPLASLRILAGGGVFPRPEQTPPTPEDLKRRALAPVFEKSGCRAWDEFAFRFSLSAPRLLTAICGTKGLARFERHLELFRGFKPLAPAVVAEVLALHRQWAWDAQAKP